MEEKAKELSQLIQNSTEYIEYRKIYDKIKLDNNLVKRLDEYRAKSFMIQVDGGNSVREKQDRLAGEYHDVMSNGDARECLDREMIFCRMVQRINKLIYEDIELSTDKF